MLQKLFEAHSVGYSLPTIGLSVVSSIILGLLVATIYMYHNTYSKNFVITLASLPVLVQLIVMLVNMNGNLGTGMAVLGAFSLIRFRSVAGNSRDIATIFWAMGVGLAAGMGYVFYAFFFSVIVAIYLLILNTSRFGDRGNTAERELKITIPEELDFPGLFDSLFEKYGYEYRYDAVRTTTMGSAYELSYYIKLRNVKQEKQLIDDIRVRNGNMPVISSKISSKTNEL